jgi:hypothetical protein
MSSACGRHTPPRSLRRAKRNGRSTEKRSTIDGSSEGRGWRSEFSGAMGRETAQGHCGGSLPPLVITIALFCPSSFRSHRKARKWQPVRSASVRFVWTSSIAVCLAEVRPAKVRSAEVHTALGVLCPPVVSDGSALPSSGDSAIVRSASRTALSDRAAAACRSAAQPPAAAMADYDKRREVVGE